MSHSKDPPQLPKVVDEAGASPGWVPLLGLGLLCAVALVIALRQAVAELMPPPPPAAAVIADGGMPEPDEADEGDEAAAAPAAEAPPGH
jgi:hypothetical protein